MQAAQASAKQYADSLAKVEFGPDVPPGVPNSEDPFAAVSDRARAFFQRWVQAHPEIEKVMPGAAP